MLNFAEIFLKYFWVMAIIVGIFNYFFLKKISPKNFNEQEKEELNRIYTGFLLFSIFPFITIGLMQVLGGFQNFFFIFSGDYKSIYVLLSWVSIVGVWLISLYWVFFKDGASKLVKYKIFLNIFFINELSIKALFLVLTAAGVLGLIQLFTQNN